MVRNANDIVYVVFDKDLPPKQNFRLIPCNIRVTTDSKSNNQSDGAEDRCALTKNSQYGLPYYGHPIQITYQRPKVNTKITRIFLVWLSCNLKTACTGKIKII